MATLFLLPETQHQRDPDRRTGVRAYLRVFDFLKFEALRRLLLVFLLFALPFALYVSMFSLFADRQLHFSAEQRATFSRLSACSE
jgi:hypothetical protein